MGESWTTVPNRSRREVAVIGISKTVLCGVSFLPLINDVS